MENQVVSKKSILSNNCMPFFNFCHDLKDFETAKNVFLQVKKCLMGMRIFFVANSRVKITKGNPLWLCTAGETTAKLLTMMNIVLFSCETGAFIWKSKNRFTTSTQFF